MNKKALIFDLDGTLVNTVSDIAGAVNAMLEHYGFPKHDDEAVQRMIGKGAKNLITQALPDKNRTPEFIDEALECYRSCYDRNLIVKTYVYEGLHEVLLTLKNDGVKMAVLSNKDDRHVKEIVKKLMPGFFISADGFSPLYPHKPAPDAVLAIMKKMGVTREETAFVGDSAVDVQTAKNVGMTSVGVSWGFGGAAAFSDNVPDIIVDLPSELLNL